MSLEDVFLCLGDPVSGDTRVWEAFHATTAFVTMSIVWRLLRQLNSHFVETFILEISPVREVASVVLVHWRSPLHSRFS